MHAGVEELVGAVIENIILRWDQTVEAFQPTRVREARAEGYLASGSHDDFLAASSPALPPTH